MSRTLRLSAIFTLILAMFLSACSNSSSGDETNEVGTSLEESDAGKTTISFWNRYPELDPYIPDLIEGFEEKHPSIKVDWENVVFETNEQQYQAAISENELPDIFAHPPGGITLSQMVELDLVRDLNEVFTQDVKDQFIEGVWAENYTTLGDNVYALPLFSPNHGVILLYYNKAVLEQFGYDENDVPVTWDEMINIGKDIYRQSNGEIYGLGIGAEHSFLNTDTIVQMATAINPEVTSNGINFKTGEIDFTQDAIIETMDFFKIMMDDNVLDPRSLETIDKRALLMDGQVAFITFGNWAAAEIANDSEDEWGLAPLPTKDGQPYYKSATGSDMGGFFVSNNTENWSEVKLFLEYMLEHVYEDIVVAAGTTQPAKELTDVELPFPQYEDLDRIMTELNYTVPDMYQRDVDKMEPFMINFGTNIPSTSIGDVLGGYLSNQVQDLEAELQNLTDQTIQAFKQTIEAHPDVSKDDFIFPNWEPFEHYTNDLYEELGNE